MKKVHTTKDGQQMLIAEMKDSHLINTINLWCGKLVEFRSVLESDHKSTTSRFNRALYDLADMEDIQDGAESAIEKFPELLAPYVLEACLRNLNVSGILQEGFDRKVKLEIPPLLRKQLQPLNDIDFDGEYECGIWEQD